MFHKNIIWEILKKSKKIEKKINLKWVIFLIGKEGFPTSTCHSYRWWHAAKVTSDLLVGLKTQVYDDVALLLPFQWTDDDGSVQELRESKVREMLQQLEKIKSFWRKKAQFGSWLQVLLHQHQWRVAVVDASTYNWESLYNSDQIFFVLAV